MTQNGIVTGLVERAFFAVAVATNLGGTTVAMVAWTVMKQDTLWKGFAGTENEREFLFVSMMASLGSMVIAVIAGKVCCGELWFT